GIESELGALDPGRPLLEQLNLFSAHRHLPIGNPREVAGWARLVAEITGTDRIADRYENNRYSADFRLNSRRHQVGVGDQHIRCEAHQLHEGRAYPAGIREGKASINADIAPFLPTKLLAFLP